MTTLSSAGTSLLVLLAFVVIVLVALRVAQSIFGTGGKRAAATEVAARLVAYPTGSDGVLRRRFVRALTGQHVIMPSGERLAFSDLTVRVCPEDLERLDPDGDLERLGADAASLYRTHAEREGWATPARVNITVEVDPGLRSGWVPPARGSRKTDAAGPLGQVVRGTAGADTGAETGPMDALPIDGGGADTRRPAWLDWDNVGQQPAPPVRPAARPDVLAARTIGFPSPAPAADDEDDAPTVDVGASLRLERDGEVAVVTEGTSVVLGRLLGSPLRITDDVVSHRHAAIRQNRGRWQVKDLGSTNGTSIDGVDVDAQTWTPLPSRAVIELAGVRITTSTQTTGTVHRESVRTR